MMMKQHGDMYLDRKAHERCGMYGLEEIERRVSLRPVCEH